MKKIAHFAVLTILLTAVLAGCGGNAAVVTLASAPSSAASASPSPSVRTEETALTSTPTATAQTEETASCTPAPTINAPLPTAQPEVYVIDGSKLYRQSEEEYTLIYDAAAYFPKGWDCRAAHLKVEDGILYFSEGGVPGDDYEDSQYRIIRIDKYGRTVLDEKRVIGYTQLIPYGDRIMFVQDGFDSQEIGWASKDGSASAYLDFSDYASRYGVEPYYNGATIYMDNGVLYADIAFFTDGDPEIVDHTVSISKDLEITRIK